MSENEETPEQSTPAYLFNVLLALVLVVVVCVRIRLLAVPFERDEGEFAYIGQLLLKGLPPFTHAYTMKLPGVSVVYALFMFLFGQSAAAVHIGLLTANLISIFLVFLLARRLFERNTALISCASFAILSLSESVRGVFAHATHFVVLFALAGFLLLLRFLDRDKISLLFLSGLCFGLAVTMKQHAALFVVFAFSFLAWRGWKNPVSGGKRLAVGGLLFLLGIMIPYALIVLWMFQSGAFHEFWFWTVQYAREYASGRSLRQGLDDLAFTRNSLVTAQPLLWLLAASGAVVLCRNRSRYPDRPFVLGFVLFSFLSVCPGLVFRQHYFVMLLPAAAILIGVAVNSAMVAPVPSAAGTVKRYLALFLLGAGICFGFFHERNYLFSYTPQQVSRASYGANPFPEAPQIARYLKDHTGPDDRIAVLGSEPEILFYADRVSATGHIYMYGLMENQPYAERMQIQMIREIETARPKYVVFVNVDVSWLITSSSKQNVLSWGENYVESLYEPVGVIDIVDPATTNYVWGTEANVYKPFSNSYLSVFKRKG